MYTFRATRTIAKYVQRTKLFKHTQAYSTNPAFNHSFHLSGAWHRLHDIRAPLKWHAELLIPNAVPDRVVTVTVVTSLSFPLLTIVNSFTSSVTV